MDFARETRGHTAHAACGYTSFGGQGVDNAFVSFPNYWKHLFEDTAAIPVAHSTRGPPMTIGEHVL